jgi:hypothetical protein
VSFVTHITAAYNKIRVKVTLLANQFPEMCAIQPFKAEALTAEFKDPVRTAL